MENLENNYPTTLTQEQLDRAYAICNEFGSAYAGVYARIVDLDYSITLGYADSDIAKATVELLESVNPVIASKILGVGCAERTRTPILNKGETMNTYKYCIEKIGESCFRATTEADGPSARGTGEYPDLKTARSAIEAVAGRSLDWESGSADPVDGHGDYWIAKWSPSLAQSQGLRWLVVRMHGPNTRFVIASFLLEEDARAFAAEHGPKCEVYKK